jgi:hypothetical protein
MDQLRLQGRNSKYRSKSKLAHEFRNGHSTFFTSERIAVLEFDREEAKSFRKLFAKRRDVEGNTNVFFSHRALTLSILCRVSRSKIHVLSNVGFF